MFFTNSSPFLIEAFSSGMASAIIFSSKGETLPMPRFFSMPFFWMRGEAERFYNEVSFHEWVCYRKLSLYHHHLILDYLHSWLLGCLLRSCKYLDLRLQSHSPYVGIWALTLHAPWTIASMPTLLIYKISIVSTSREAVNTQGQLGTSSIQLVALNVILPDMEHTLGF